MAEFYLQVLDVIFHPEKYVNATDGNETETEEEETQYPPCKTKVPFIEFHLYLLIPSVIVSVAMAFTMRRKLIRPSFLGGRPGFVFAMDILGKSNRFSYAAAWGMLAYLAGDIIFSQQYAVNFTGPKFVTVFKALISMAIYGMDYFPIFAALALESALGYIVGTAYAWMLFGVTVFQIAECPMPTLYRVNIILGSLPKIICQLYLAFSLPVRLIQAMRNKTASILSATEMVAFLDMTKDLGKTVEAIHVKKLLRPPPPPPDPPASIVKKILGIFKDLAHNWIYHRHSNFRYSSRVLSVMVIGVILIYTTTYELMFGIVSLFDWVELMLQAQLEFWGWDYIPGEIEFAHYVRSVLYLIYYLLISFKGCFITSLSLSALFSCLMILHMLSSYRTNLLQLYKGDNTHIPPRSVNSNASLLVGSMRYAGYQVGYIGWGYFIMFIVLLLISCALAVIITLIRIGIYQWILDLLLAVWPVVAMTLVINILQVIVAKFAFLQERGEYLAINNRRVLFTFTFFMFFYNIFMGVVSCLLRITKSMIIGTLFLCRLDNSALPRRFQLFDPGFAAYVGFIHVECVHTHPVVICFLRILMLTQKYKELKKVEDEKQDPSLMEKGGKQRRQSRKISARARANWYIMYTLYNNPGIRIYRKAYIDYMNRMKERLFRNYNLNKTSLGKLVKGVNKSMAPVDITHLDIEKQDKLSPANNPMMNWTAMLGANKFLMALQREVMQKEENTANGVMEMTSLTKVLEPTNNSVRSRENSDNTSNHTTKPASLWGRARNAASRTPNTQTNEVHINEVYLEEKL